MNVISELKILMKESQYMMKTIARLYRLVHYNNAWKYRLWGAIQYPLVGLSFKVLLSIYLEETTLLLLGQKPDCLIAR